jgi:hypothetical protein
MVRIAATRRPASQALKGKGAAAASSTQSETAGGTASGMRAILNP